MLDEASPLGKEISFMMPLTVTDHQAPVPPPSYQRGQARRGPALHIDALTLVTTLHLLALCHLAVRLAHRRCSPPLPAGPGGAPRIYDEETLLLISLLRTRLPALVSGYARLVARNGLLWLELVGCRWAQMEPRVLPVPRSNANVVAPPGLLCLSHFSSSRSYTPCDGDSLEPVI